MIQPVIGSITGIKFFPRENADAGEGNKVQFTFLRSGCRIWTQTTINGFVVEIIVRKSAITRGVLLRVNVQFRVQRTEVRRLVRGENGLGVPDVNAPIFADS